MWRPKPDKDYVFVKVIDGEVDEWILSRAAADGSGGIQPRGANKAMIDGDWRSDLTKLLDAGFIEQGDARRRGLISDDWAPQAS